MELSNTQNSFQLLSSTDQATNRCGQTGGKSRKMRGKKNKPMKLKKSKKNKKVRKHRKKSQKGGMGGSGVTFASLNEDAVAGAGLTRPTTVSYENCGGKNMMGGGELMNKMNHAGAGSYGYTSAGAQLSDLVRGSYPVYSETTRTQCGGKKKVSKKSNKSKKSKKSNKRKKGKKSKMSCVAVFGPFKIGGKRKTKKGRKCKNNRKSRNKRKGRKNKGRKTMQRGGFFQNGLHLPKTLNYSVGMDNLGSTPWATAPVSIENTGGEMVDNYNHYKGTHTPTVEQDGAVQN